VHFAIAILLAAGASTRMGSIKALNHVGTTPAVRHLATQYAESFDHCIVVTGYHHQQVEAALAGLNRVSCVRNPDPVRGQFSSLQCGLREAASMGARWYLFAPVDWMGIGPAVLHPLLAGMRAADPGELLCIPECQGPARAPRRASCRAGA
jgi:molybdenum cofactor cytidylyltransferase